MEQAVETTVWQTITEIELVYRNPVKPSQRPQILGSREAAGILRQSWDKDKIEIIEEGKVLLLNRGSRVIGVMHLSSGGTYHTVIDVKIILATALKANAHYIILAHNHPSGELNPSAADRNLTEKLKCACDLLTIGLLDHLILTNEGYYSFSEKGQL